MASLRSQILTQEVLKSLHSGSVGTPPPPVPRHPVLYPQLCSTSDTSVCHSQPLMVLACLCSGQLSPPYFLRVLTCIHALPWQFLPVHFLTDRFQPFQLPQILLSASSARQDHHNFLGIQLSVSWLENDCQAEDCVITGSLLSGVTVLHCLLRTTSNSCLMYFKAVYGGRTSPVPVTPSWSETEGGLFNSKSNLLFNYKINAGSLQ